MYKIPKQRFTQEFKQEAVRQVESEGKSAAQVAQAVRQGRTPEAKDEANASTVDPSYV